jgi:hypothetical protein
VSTASCGCDTARADHVVRGVVVNRDAASYTLDMVCLVCGTRWANEVSADAMRDSARSLGAQGLAQEMQHNATQLDDATGTG